MGGDHGHGPPKVPDYRIYKVENCPQLVRAQKMLEKHGLKDPWLRNEVWRYYPGSEKYYSVPLKNVFYRKIHWGLGLAVLTILGEKVYHHFYPEESHHH